MTMPLHPPAVPAQSGPAPATSEAMRADAPARAGSRLLAGWTTQDRRLFVANLAMLQILLALYWPSVGFWYAIVVLGAVATLSFHRLFKG